jgi:hypothetical protein
VANVVFFRTAGHAANGVLVLVRFLNSGHGLFYDEKDKLFEELLRFHEENVGEKTASQVPA